MIISKLKDNVINTDQLSKSYSGGLIKMHRGENISKFDAHVYLKILTIQIKPTLVFNFIRKKNEKTLH